MTEDQARDLIGERFGADVLSRTARFLDMVTAETERQNLIAASTLPDIWARHALDSLQLLRLAPADEGLWIDVGTGGGFPGILVGIARTAPTLLVEPRRKRAEFLQTACDALGIADRVKVTQQKMERVMQPAAIISARAVASIEALMDMAHQCAGPATRWLLPRGQIAAEEISSLRQRWTFMFHVEQSEADPRSAIAIFDRVKRR